VRECEDRTRKTQLKPIKVFCCPQKWSVPRFCHRVVIRTLQPTSNGDRLTIAKIEPFSGLLSVTVTSYHSPASMAFSTARPRAVRASRPWASRTGETSPMDKKINPCSVCGKPSDFFIVRDSPSVHVLMTWESVEWRCLHCMLKWYFPGWMGHAGPGSDWIGHRATAPSAKRKQRSKHHRPRATHR
jgi:hypothetical protein